MDASIGTGSTLVNRVFSPVTLSPEQCAKTRPGNQSRPLSRIRSCEPSSADRARNITGAMGVGFALARRQAAGVG